ncbi:TadE family protein [Pigmentiphaga sp.]|uniref:TadE family protein n=1 Tax=Pigmentiphaga sp. TaxID=1977564 RepID=UPI00128DA7DF|nr:TadE family protein [Pigmentiphaga sp.]MPS29409.1 pilus assembly protein [Alcaligenaceae bacterium SAGV5]MPS55447.1 pilus assembly protein [Alcaligenaceae bacterium SAGV3]MPT60138.1 pilus assembly protein [Alcaligenaceae bacterium]
MVKSADIRTVAKDRWHGATSQQGAYATEFALIFPIFFLVFYGVLSFGLIFTTQQSLTLAVEEGARASLRYYLPSAAGSGFMAQMQGRLAHGCEVAKLRAAWLGEVGGGTITPTCTASIKGPCVKADGTMDTASSCTTTLGAASAGSSVACGYRQEEMCFATLNVSYAYSANPLVPSLPGTFLVIPDVLSATARVALDPGALQLGSSGGGA